MILKIHKDRRPPDFKTSIVAQKRFKWLNGAKIIEHKYDHWGYRNSISLEEHIKKGKFGLALGCSHTFGTGIFEEQRYTNVLAKEIGIPVYNAGMPGVANNFLTENSMELIKNNVKPKFVIIQMISPYRYTYYGGKDILKIVPEKQTGKFYNMLEECKGWYLHNFVHTYTICKYLWESQGTKVISYRGSGAMFQEVTTLGLDLISCAWEKDRAADFDHSGPASNGFLAKQLLQFL